LGFYIFCGLYLASAIVAAVTPVHMYQLSSYQLPGYFRWLKEFGGRTVLPSLLLPGLLVWVHRSYPWVAIGIYTAQTVVDILVAVRTHRKAKKPLKFTSRVIRLFAVLALLLGGIVCTAYAAETWRYVILAGGYIGVLLWVPLAGLICLPIQNCINSRYIKDAKKRLKAMPHLQIIGVTGSYGKTSVKYYLARLLEVKYNVLMTPESYNTPMGIVRTVRERLEPSHQIFVCEMGARHRGDIKELCDIVCPHHGILTAIGPQHLETQKTQENITLTKFDLINALPTDGLAFLGWDNELIREHKIDRNAIKYGLGDNPDLDYRAQNLTADLSGSHFDIVTKKGERQRYTAGLLGRHNVENLTGAIAAAHMLGIPLAQLVQPVHSLKPPPHRLELMPRSGGMTVIDDAYNANPAGTRAALDALNMFSAVKIMITPGMVELGGIEEQENRNFGEYAAGICDYVALVGAVKHTLPIAEGLATAGFMPANMEVFSTFGEAFAWVREIDSQGKEKVVLLENDLPDNY